MLPVPAIGTELTGRDSHRFHQIIQTVVAECGKIQPFAANPVNLRSKRAVKPKFSDSVFGYTRGFCALNTDFRRYRPFFRAVLRRII